jgi:ribosomal protein L37AE/L43A
MTPLRDRERVRKRSAERKEFFFCPECGKKITPRIPVE